MKGNFFKNVTYMSFGTFFRFILSLIVTAVYVRAIGMEGYATIGIIASFFIMVSRLDIPYFLSLVKYNSEYYMKEKRSFENVFNTLYNSVLIGNIILFILLAPIFTFLSIGVYKDTNLIPFYFIAALTFMISRANSLIRNFLRANKHEVAVQKAMIPGIVIGFLSSIILLFLSKIGVMSVFIGVLIGTFLDYSILTANAKKFVSYRPYFSLNLFIGILKSYTLQNYWAQLFPMVIIFGGLFMSGFLLDQTSFGILTILVSIHMIVREYYMSLFVHISPIYSSLIIRHDHKQIGKITKSITILLLVISTLATIFLLFLGEPIYFFYFGVNLNGTYFLFLLMFLSVIFYLSLIAVYGYFFIMDTKLNNKIMLFLVMVFFALLFPLIYIFGLFGAVASYFIVNFLRLIVYLLFMNKLSITGAMDKDTMLFLLISISSIALTLTAYGTKFLFTPVLVLFVLIISFVLIAKIKEISRNVRYIVSEI